MTDPRPAASLTSGLLARRGDARPAMRRQPLANLAAPLSLHEDLGWNDIGHDVTPEEPPATSLAAMTSPERVAKPQEVTPLPVPGASVAPVQSPVNRQLEVIARRLQAERAGQGLEPTGTPAAPRRMAPEPDMIVPVEAAAASTRKAAFTLRLDPERHLRLRLLSAVSHRSAQQLLIEALDALLARHEKVEHLAGQVETGAVAGSFGHDDKKQV